MFDYYIRLHPKIFKMIMSQFLESNGKFETFKSPSMASFNLSL